MTYSTSQEGGGEEGARCADICVLSQIMSGKAGHPAYFDPQIEKAFQKQPGVFLNKKQNLKTKSRIAR